MLAGQTHLVSLNIERLRLNLMRDSKVFRDVRLFKTVYFRWQTNENEISKPRCRRRRQASADDARVDALEQKEQFIQSLIVVIKKNWTDFVFKEHVLLSLWKFLVQGQKECVAEVGYRDGEEILQMIKTCSNYWIYNFLKVLQCFVRPARLT